MMRAYHWCLALLLGLLLNSGACAADKRAGAAGSHGGSDSARPAPIAVLSIIPAQGEPGKSVVLVGTGFTEQTRVILGNNELPSRLLGPEQLTFDIPRIPPGLYALFLRGENGTSSRTYNFTLLPLKPTAVSLTPDTIFACSTGQERLVQVSGQNFQDKSQVLFDGAAIRSRVESADQISFITPAVAGGLHQVQIKNPEETTSTILGLMIDARPEIERINRGEEFTNYYNLEVHGRNFQPGAALLLEERSLDQGSSYLPVGRRLTVGGASAAERERVIYVNCTTLIYQRYPYSTVSKDFQIQVQNPNGEASSPVSVSAP